MLNTVLTMHVTFTGLEHRLLYRVLGHSCYQMSHLMQNFCLLKLPFLGSPCATNWCSTVPQFSLGTQHLFNNDKKFYVFCGTRMYTAGFSTSLYLHRDTSIHFTYSYSFSLRYTSIIFPYPVLQVVFFSFMLYNQNFMCISYLF